MLWYLLLPLFLAAEVREPWPPLWFMESSARVLLGAWLFALGASVGSFLNVVVYRLPRGMSLAHPGSQCPTCGHAIRGRDNLPILSWLLLGGKCRDCRSPISPRYYYIELTVGLTFLLVAIFEAFLPRQVWIGTDLVRRSPTWHEVLPFWSAYATHVVLLTTLIGAALIDSDARRAPRGLFVPTIILSLVVGALFPVARPIVAIPDLAVSPWKLGLIESAAGLAAGMACGALFGLCWLGGSRGQSWPRSAPVMVMAAAGGVLGWQRILVLGPLAALMFAALVIVVRLARGPGVVPLAAVVAVLAGWSAVEWAAGIMPVVLRLTSDPLTGGEISALAIAAGAILAGALAPATYHSVLPLQGATTGPPQQQGPGSPFASAEALGATAGSLQQQGPSTAATTVESVTGKPLTGEPPAP